MGNYHFVPKQYMSRQHPDYILMGQPDVHHKFKISTYICNYKVRVNDLIVCKIYGNKNSSHLHDVLDILKVLIELYTHLSIPNAYRFIQAYLTFVA